MTTFIQGEMQRRIKDGFSFLLPAADAVQLLGEKLDLTHITVVPQAHCRPHLILNLSARPDVGTPSVNNTTDREAALESLQFGPPPPPCILQAVREADPDQGPVGVSKLDVTDAYHCSTVTPSHGSAFAYIVPLAPGDEG